MPLMRGRIVGYDANRMTFEFTMMHERRNRRLRDQQHRDG